MRTAAAEYPRLLLRHERPASVQLDPDNMIDCLALSDSIYAETGVEHDGTAIADALRTLRSTRWTGAGMAGRLTPGPRARRRRLLTVTGLLRVSVCPICAALVAAVGVDAHERHHRAEGTRNG